MSLSLHCQCGRIFAVDRQLLGELVRCPACQRPLTVSELSEPAPAISTAERSSASAPDTSAAVPEYPGVTTAQPAPATTVAESSQRWLWSLIGIVGVGVFVLTITRIWLEMNPERRPPVPLKSAETPQNRASQDKSHQGKSHSVTAVQDGTESDFPSTSAGEVPGTELPLSQSPTADEAMNDASTEASGTTDSDVSVVAAENAVLLANEPELQWKILYDASTKPQQRLQSLRKLEGDRQATLQFRGPGGDPNLMDGFVANGAWSINPGGGLMRNGGSATALKLGTHRDFELELHADFPGVGGWFLIWGWNGQRGHLLYNVKLQKSSIWYVYDARNGRFINRRVAVSDYRWEGHQHMRVRVSQGTLDLGVTDSKITQDFDVTPHLGGEVWLGTAATEYGGIALQITTLRILELTPTLAP